MTDLIRLVPNLRFPAFIENGEWKVHKLGDIAHLYKGKGISKNDVTGNGAIPCIRYGESYTHYKEVIDKVASYTDLPIDDLFMSKANDVQAYRFNPNGTAKEVLSNNPGVYMKDGKYFIPNKWDANNPYLIDNKFFKRIALKPIGY